MLFKLVFLMLFQIEETKIRALPTNFSANQLKALARSRRQHSRISVVVFVFLLFHKTFSSFASFFLLLLPHSLLPRASPLPTLIAQRLWFPVPSRPRNFQAITVSPNLIQLAWEPPEGSEDSPTNRVLEYLLKYSAAGSVRVSSRVLPGDKKAYLMQNLTPDTSYTILLTAKTNEGRGVPAKTTGKTKEYGELSSCSGIRYPFRCTACLLRVFRFFFSRGKTVD